MYIVVLKMLSLFKSSCIDVETNKMLKCLKLPTSLFIVHPPVENWYLNTQPTFAWYYYCLIRLNDRCIMFCDKFKKLWLKFKGNFHSLLNLSLHVLWINIGYCCSQNIANNFNQINFVTLQKYQTRRVLYTKQSQVIEGYFIYMLKYNIMLKVNLTIIY